MNTSVRFTFDKVVFDKSNYIHSVISLSAPKLDRTSKRPPICVIPVIDVSGSMGYATTNGGRSFTSPMQQVNKLDYAKKSVAKLIDHLQPGDYFGAVAFESSIYDIFPTTAIDGTSKVKMQAEIAKLRPLGGTNMAGGILRGIDFAKSLDLPKEVLVRVILFTDGCANEGPAKDQAGISKLMTANMGDRVTLSMFGYGNDADQELLTSLASSGKGNYAFIDNPDKAATAFAKELGGLLSTYAQNIKIVVEPLGENAITKVVSDVTVTDDDDKHQKIGIEVADILSEESRHIVLALKTGLQKQVFPRPVNVLSVKVEYDLIGDDGKKEHKVEEIKGKIEFVKAGDEQKDPTQNVVDIVAVHAVLEAQLEAEQLATSGNFAAAYNVMVGLQGACGPQGSFGQQGCQGAVGMAEDLAAKYVSASSYTKSAGSRGAYRSSVKSRALFADKGTENIMFSCNLGSQNSVQSAMMDSFTQGGDSQRPDPMLDVSNIPVDTWNSMIPVNTTAAPLTSSVLITSDGSPSEPQNPSKKGLKKSRSKRW